MHLCQYQNRGIKALCAHVARSSSATSAGANAGPSLPAEATAAAATVAAGAAISNSHGTERMQEKSDAWHQKRSLRHAFRRLAIHREMNQRNQKTFVHWSGHHLKAKFSSWWHITLAHKASTAAKALGDAHVKRYRAKRALSDWKRSCVLSGGFRRGRDDDESNEDGEVNKGSSNEMGERDGVGAGSKHKMVWRERQAALADSFRRASLLLRTVCSRERRFLAFCTFTVFCCLIWLVNILYVTAYGFTCWRHCLSIHLLITLLLALRCC